MCPTWGLGERDYDAILRQRLLDSRAQAASLRLDLGDATAMIEALEAELWSVTKLWRGNTRDQRQLGPEALSLLLQARTLLRRKLFQELGPIGIQPAALADLRLAEVAFCFLMGLRSLRADRGSEPGPKWIEWPEAA